MKAPCVEVVGGEVLTHVGARMLLFR